MALKKVTMELTEELVDAIDDVRGDVPRGRWIERVCREHPDVEALQVNYSTRQERGKFLRKKGRKR